MKDINLKISGFLTLQNNATCKAIFFRCFFSFDSTLVKVKTFLSYCSLYISIYLSLSHTHTHIFKRYVFVLLQIKARQMEHAKKELDRDIGQLKDQLEQQQEHRIEQERRVGTCSVLSATLCKTS